MSRLYIYNLKNIKVTVLPLYYSDFSVDRVIHTKKKEFWDLNKAWWKTGELSVQWNYIISLSWRKISQVHVQRAFFFLYGFCRKNWLFSNSKKLLNITNMQRTQICANLRVSIPEIPLCLWNTIRVLQNKNISEQEYW